MSVIEEKKALRTFIRQKERTLDPAYKAESSEAICRCILALPEYLAAEAVFAFAGTVHEIDTSLLLHETIAAGKTLVLPRCAAGHAIDLCVVRSMDDLESGAYGILEPGADCPRVEPEEIDLIFVPGTAFDVRGHRIGQGGGYYDRYLNRTRAVRVGVCHDFALLSVVPSEAHDARMDIVVTPGRTVIIREETT